MPSKKGKRSYKEAKTSDDKSNGTIEIKALTLWDGKGLDPALQQLFSSSAGPVKAPPTARYEEPLPRQRNAEPEPEGESEKVDTDDAEEDFNSLDEDLEDTNLSDLSADEAASENEPQLKDLLEASLQRRERKRKRNDEEEDLEGKYIEKLAREEEKEELERQAERKLKRQRLKADQVVDKLEGSEHQDTDMEGKASADENSESIEGTADKVVPADIPVHESLQTSNESTELEKASRTVFLANVSTTAISSKSANKAFIAHMGSFFASLSDPPVGKPAHKVESHRFRSTAYSTTALPKKASFAKKELMASTTKSTNAYVVYSTAYAAREAVKRLNGTVVLDRHLRVDGVAHPAKTDHKRCVFVGNLGFVDDESMMEQGGEFERKRSKIPSDIEEGLWRQFGKAGTVESVRVVRDEKTRVGKGFAYVQFHDPNAVEAALLFNERKYPPMLPRPLRVVRAKAVKKTALASAACRENMKSKNAQKSDKERIYNPKISAEASSLQGRASKLLGRAGAAQFNTKAGSGANGMPMGKRGRRKDDGVRPPESFVFEGYRATSKSGKPKGLKIGGGGGKKKREKPRTRSTKRASDWKKGGGKRQND